MVVILGAATYYLSIERSNNPKIASIKGVPEVVVLLVGLVVVLSFLLSRTAFGRHVYAVGGNAEAARRAGIGVENIKLICFIICSVLAATAGILFGSRNNSISPSTGGGTVLLLARCGGGHRRHEPVRRQGARPRRRDRRLRGCGDPERHEPHGRQGVLRLHLHRARASPRCERRCIVASAIVGLRESSGWWVPHERAGRRTRSDGTICRPSCGKFTSGASTSRAQLTEATGLNRSTIGVLVSELVAAGLVLEDAPVASGGAGRPSIVVRPAADVYVVSVDVGVDHLSAARVGLGGVIQARREVVQGRTNPSVAIVLKRLERLVRQVLADAPESSRCVGLGASVCGTVRSSDGLVRLSPNLDWVDVPLGESLSGRLSLGVPWVIGNDADFGALAEMARGIARGCRERRLSVRGSRPRGGRGDVGTALGGQRRLRRRGGARRRQREGEQVPLWLARVLGDRGGGGCAARWGSP